MKAIAFAVLALMSVSALADKYTNGHFRKDGTYVQGYYSSSSNGTKLDNYSTQGNVNPYTGRSGSVNPYAGQTSNYGYQAPSYVSPYQQPRSKY